MERLAAWYSVGIALCNVVICQLDDVEVVDFWTTARGIRVAYKWRGVGVSSETQVTIPVSRCEVDRLMEAVQQ